MSKVIDATCEGGSVTADGVEVEGAQILSKGLGESQGLLLIGGSRSIYVTSSATDLESTIESLSDSLGKIVNILTAIGAGMTGPTTAPPPTLGADLAEITAIVTELETLKGALK